MFELPKYLATRSKHSPRLIIEPKNYRYYFRMKQINNYNPSEHIIYISQHF